MKLVRLIKMFLKIKRIVNPQGKYLSANFPIENSKKIGYIIASAFQLCSRICHLESPGRPGGIEIKIDTSTSGC
jgi:hypothetical protein